MSQPSPLNQPSQQTPPQATAEEFLDRSAHDREQYLASGGVPPRMSEDQVLSLAPQTREAYYQSLAASGIDGGTLWAWVRRLEARAQASDRAHDLTDERVRELSPAGEVQQIGGLAPSNANYPGVPHAEMTRYVTEEFAPDEVGDFSTAYHELHVAFSEFATELKEAVAASRHEWQGGAADSAHGYFESLSTWADNNSLNAQLASEVMQQQSGAAVQARNNMPEEVPFSWESEMKKWGESPLDLTDSMRETIETYQRHHEAHEQAAQVMHQYDSDLFTAASKQPAFAEPPEFGGSESGSDAGSGVISIGGDTGTSASGATGTPSGGVAAAAAPSGAAYTPPVSSGGSGGSGSPAPTPLPGGPTTGVGPGTGGTAPSGTRPATAPPHVPAARGNAGGGVDFGGAGAVPPGGVGAAGGFGPGGGGSSFGRAGGGFGPGGGSSLGRAGGGFGPGGGGAGAGPGATSGGARPGAMAGPGGAAAAGGTGAASAGRGGAGAAPMGAGAGRGGQGGEDSEHDRPSYLVEADPDEVFGTDQRTAPPVIGE